MESFVTSAGSAAESSAGRVLAIDYGRKRLGIAISDALGITARPFATWKRSGSRRDLARLRTICRDNQISRIVVGWPLRLGGTEGEMAAEAARFAERIRKEFSLPVELVDERLSSWEAKETLRETVGISQSGKRKQRKLDEVAAAVILSDYLRRTSSAS